MIWTRRAGMTLIALLVAACATNEPLGTSPADRSTSGVTAPSTADSISDEDSDAPVRISRGNEHCGWESVEILHVPADLSPPPLESGVPVDFFRDTKGVMPESLVYGEYDGDATLPDSAVDTGYDTRHGALWMAPDMPDVAFLVTAEGTVQRWPSGSPAACA